MEAKGGRSSDLPPFVFLALHRPRAALAHVGQFAVGDGRRAALFQPFLDFIQIPDAGFLVCCYLLSFDKAVDDLLGWRDAATAAREQLIAYRWAPFGVAVALWGRLLMRAERGESTRVPWEEWLCPIGLLYCNLLGVTGTASGTLFVSLVFNLICLGIAAMWMVRGCRDGLLRETVLGSVLLAVVVFARYFDLFESLATRGLAFLLLGGLLVAEGFYYRRCRQTAESEGGAQ